MISPRTASTFFTAAILALTASATSSGADALPHVPAGFTIERIATVSDARELAFTPQGDLFVGTYGTDVYVVPNAEGQAGEPHVFASFDRGPAAGVLVNTGTLYVGTQFGVWRTPIRPGQLQASAAPERIAAVRTSGRARDHETVTLAMSDGALYASVGSSCNACQPELDDTRATIERIESGGRITPKAIHIRNAIALATSESGTMWAGVAGADDLPLGHPYEIFDAVTAHAGVVDYGWPWCYENRKGNPVAQWTGHDCSKTAVPRVVLPAYETPIGAAFYPSHPAGSYAFPARYRGGAFVTLHGSWHGPREGLPGYIPPRVVFVPMHGDEPATPVNWNDPTAQWSEFVGAYQEGGTINRIGRPTGVAVGPQGDLFVSDDQTGSIYRIRPSK